MPAPSEEFPEGVCEKSDCMKVGRGRHVGMEAGAGMFDVKRDTRSGRHSRSGHADSATKRDHGEATMRIHGRKIMPREKLMCGGCVEGVIIDVKLAQRRLWDS